MSNWRCPHCGTPQAETARCWVCGRSTTTCLSCRHFRHSVALGVGYCGLDAGRAPLTGAEVRPCWEPIVRSNGGRALPVLPEIQPDVRLELQPDVDPDVFGGFSPGRR